MTSFFRFASLVGPLCLVLFVWLWSEELIKIERSLIRDGESVHALFVIAHPDDEALFFSPLISALAHWNHKISVLCLSTGDAYGVGSKRRQELLDNMRVNFGVPESRVSIIDHEDMKDGMDKDWSDEVVSAAILSEVGQSSTSVDLFVTFDSWGISGHKNHNGAHKGLIAAIRSLGNRTSAENALSDGEKEGRPQFWFLRSKGPLRLFLGPFDFIASRLLQRLPVIPGARRTVIVPAPDLTTAMRAMLVHKSQITWYRLIFSVLSCYSYINTYDIIE